MKFEDFDAYKVLYSEENEAKAIELVRGSKNIEVVVISEKSRGKGKEIIFFIKNNNKLKNLKKYFPEGKECDAFWYK